MAPVANGCDDTVPRRIKEAVPDARFIYLLRDPVDCTISAYWHDRRSGRLSEDLRTTVDGHPFYVDVSYYHSQLEAYLRCFPREQFLFIDFEELSRDPIGVANRCIVFAGLDPARGNIRFEEPRNQSFEFNGLGRVFYNLFPSERAASQFVRGVKSVTPDFVHRLAKSLMTKDTTESEDTDRDWLAERFREENRRMEAICGFRFYR